MRDDNNSMKPHALPKAQQEGDPLSDVFLFYENLDTSLFYKSLEACENATKANELLLETAKAGNIQTVSVLEHALSILVRMRMRPFTYGDIQSWMVRCSFSIHEASINALLLRLNRIVSPVAITNIKKPTAKETGTFKPLLADNVQYAPVFLPPHFDASAHHCGAPNLQLPANEYHRYLSYFSDNWRGDSSYDVSIFIGSMEDFRARKEISNAAFNMTYGMNRMAKSSIDGNALLYLLRSNIHYAAFQETLEAGLRTLQTGSASWVQTSFLEKTHSVLLESDGDYKTAFSSIGQYNFVHFLNAELRALQKSLLHLGITREDEFTLNVYSCGFICFFADVFTPSISLGASFLHEYLTLFSENLYVPEGEHVSTLFTKSYHAFANIASSVYKQNNNPILCSLVFANTLLTLIGKSDTPAEYWLPIMASIANVFDICNRVLQLDARQ